MKALPEQVQFCICTGQGWQTAAEERASSCFGLRLFPWELGVLHPPLGLLLDEVNPVAGDAQGTAVGENQELRGIRAPQIASRH